MPDTQTNETHYVAQSLRLASDSLSRQAKILCDYPGVCDRLEQAAKLVEIAAQAWEEAKSA